MATSQNPLRANVGCGATPTPGWVNLDNSPTVRLASIPVVGAIVSNLPIGAQRLRFLREALVKGVRWATATRLPFQTASMEVVYSSHMLEHLAREDAQLFLVEAHRVLRPGGVLRIVVPDLKKLVAQYVESGDADGLIDGMLMAPPPRGTFESRLRLGLFGHRGHAWMYDEGSLVATLRKVGFQDVRAVPPGESRIAEPGALNLAERALESLYVEATRG
jgi:SAM-dependent methyltransferase